MAKPTLEPGNVLDGFVIEELIHRGGMARLWSVTKPGIGMPLLMKVPILGEGGDPAAIVSFETEQMIMARLSGVHVPKFVAAGDFAVARCSARMTALGQTATSRSIGGAAALPSTPDVSGRGRLV